MRTSCVVNCVDTLLLPSIFFSNKHNLKAKILKTFRIFNNFEKF